ncbi:MAG TPA: hypothetical protein VFB27_13625 [Opitutaceae bacterium]|nr:hypothetical protein [Opitutaceae bacterium]
MQDPFTGRSTAIQGRRLPPADLQARLLDGHRQRLRALDHLVEKAAQCGIAADKDRDFVLLAEDEVSLLEGAGGEWAELGAAIRAFRVLLPVVPLDVFGFHAEAEDPFEVDAPRLRRHGGGVEALAFVDGDWSVYKFFLFREGGDVGATFQFTPADSAQFAAVAVPGSYRLLFAKLRVIHELGMPTEVVGITPEGIVIAKQTFGHPLPEGMDTSQLDPHRLVPFPSRFLRADRDHSRLAFIDGEPWLLADTHDRNVVVDEDGRARIIDLVAAPLPAGLVDGFALLRDWIERVRLDPAATMLAPVRDEEL